MRRLCIAYGVFHRMVCGLRSCVVGEPAQMPMKLSGGDVVTISAVNDAPLFVLMVRADLKG